ncbi:hypothetical protein C8039_03130 [Halogeometricum sp. wsp3]|nr:hypothetical protein C8039_03130 [Halogeometricum sp. wsp3]
MRIGAFEIPVRRGFERQRPQPTGVRMMTQITLRGDDSERFEDALERIDRVFPAAPLKCEVVRIRRRLAVLTHSEAPEA